VEAQRRLAPHLHAAIRGAVPGKSFARSRRRCTTRFWWPTHDTPLYLAPNLPVWVDGEGYVDPATGELLPIWQQALDQLDAACSPRCWQDAD
jgi:hypothetical protein